MTRPINAAGMKLLMDFCGMPGTGAPYLSAYQDPGGVWTIGFGHTSGVIGGQVTTRAEALAWLDADLANAENDITSQVKVPLNDNQFSALVSFVFNVGTGGFNASTMLRDLNASNFADVPTQFARWNHIKGVVFAGLTRRRAVETVLWNTPVVAGSPTGAPTVAVPPPVVVPPAMLPSVGISPIALPAISASTLPLSLSADIAALLAPLFVGLPAFAATIQPAAIPAVALSLGTTLTTLLEGFLSSIIAALPKP